MSFIEGAPRIVTSRCKIVYRKPKWQVHQFKIISGDILCTVAVLKMNNSFLLWIGNGARGKCELDEIGLGMPTNENNGSSHRTSLATTLLGTEGLSTAISRRLSSFLKQPVYVCSGEQFDRFTIPLVEQGLLSEIKRKPECFR